MEVHGKVWGETSVVFNKNNVEVHRIVGKSKGYCSKHKHYHKYNMFFVEKGKIKIEIWKNYGFVDSTVLNEGQTCVVEPGQYHRFSVIDDSIAYEFYWVELDIKDISREDVGGVSHE